MLIAALFATVKTWKPAQRPRKMNGRRCAVYTIGHHSAITKNQRTPCAAPWIQLEITILSEAFQTRRHKDHMISLTCGIKNQKQTYLQNKNRLVDKSVCQGRRGWGERWNRKLGLADVSCYIQNR